MELRHSCVLPSNAPALSEAADPIPSRVLQERSANRRHAYSEDTLEWKCPLSPTENAFSGRPGGYFTGNNLSYQPVSEKSEAQIEYETKKLLGLLNRCEKYKKYRDRQPQGAKDREQRWPDHLEEAFFREGLVRWPPMGRRKHILDGQPRGRNELVADSIERDTGEPRNRKQVSSHIQVLKHILKDQPQILVYMSTEDMGGRRKSHGSASYGQLRSRHMSSKYDYAQGGANPSGLGHLPSSVALAKIQAGEDETPFTVAEFSMCVLLDSQPVHRYTQLNSNSRLSDLTVSDTTSWHKQYPEFNFHRTEEFKKHHVLVCDASIKIMTLERPRNSILDNNFYLRSRVDLSHYDSLECRTRFFEGGKPAYQIDEHERRVKETRTEAHYLPDHQGLLRLRFGASFWAQQLQRLSHMLRKAGEEEQHVRVKYETGVRRELQSLTAAQDIYGVKDGEATCVLTVLWRFNQTRSSHEPGRVSWRVVDFGRRERIRVKEEMGASSHISEALLSLVNSTSGLSPSPLPASTDSIYPPLPLDFPNQPFTQVPPALDLDALGLDNLSSDFSNPNSATVPSLATDYSQTHSLISLNHAQELSIGHLHAEYPDTNDFEFHGGHITISGCLEPAINLGAYEPYGSQHAHDQALTSLQALTGLDSHDAHQNQTECFDDLALTATLADCYATKPSWHNPGLISHLESAAETYSDLMAMQSTGGHVDSVLGGVDVGQGVLHGVGGDGGLWKLQSAFGEDTGMGAHDGRKDSVVGRVEDEHGQSLLEFMERSREERFRGF